jgi:hypothetical protein
MKKKSYLLALVFGFAVSASAFAAGESSGANIFYNEDNRDKPGQFSYVYLNPDGKTCSKEEWVSKNSDFEVTSQNEVSVGCMALKIAQRIKEKLGSCTDKTVQGSENGQILALSGPNGIVYYGFQDAKVPQECLCATITPSYTNVGPGMFNIFKDLGDGEYYDASTSVDAVSAQQCASLFDTDQQKSAVLDAYKEFGEGE